MGLIPLSIWALGNAEVQGIKVLLPSTLLYLSSPPPPPPPPLPRKLFTSPPPFPTSTFIHHPSPSLALSLPLSLSLFSFRSGAEVFFEIVGLRYSSILNKLSIDRILLHNLFSLPLPPHITPRTRNIRPRISTIDKTPTSLHLTSLHFTSTSGLQVYRSYIACLLFGIIPSQKQTSLSRKGLIWYHQDSIFTRIILHDRSIPSKNRSSSHFDHSRTIRKTIFNTPFEIFLAIPQNLVGPLETSPIMGLGGVCSHLEYQIEDMADYVAEMTMRLVDVTGSTPVTPDFRKFVLGLLSTTRLPHTTISSWHALSCISNQQVGKCFERISLGQRLVVLRSLNSTKWNILGWSLSNGVCMSILTTIDAFKAWLKNWKDWATDKKVKAATLERLSAPPAPLAPIDTNVSRTRPNMVYKNYPKSAVQERPQYVHYEHPAWGNHSYPTPQHTPPSVPDSGVTTPEYTSATGPAPQYDWGMYSQYAKAYGMGASTPYVVPDMSTRFHDNWPHHYSPQHYSPHHYSPQHYSPQHYFHQYSIWNHPASDSKQSYFMPYGYGGHQTARILFSKIRSRQRSAWFSFIRFKDKPIINFTDSTSAHYDLELRCSFRWPPRSYDFAF
ncbi:hypothetical protein EYC84_010457 [Monilinia fructicola]|uniref:Uncharacterized protein n=1 Tax=Monilinia fructicola TaxID=38448 RepID=A0A5M9JDM6_MONFR|nr:hypothetical protein EYC84_010457 [Monilinia fructicola]